MNTLAVESVTSSSFLLFAYFGSGDSSETRRATPDLLILVCVDRLSVVGDAQQGGRVVVGKSRGPCPSLVRRNRTVAQILVEDEEVPRAAIAEPGVRQPEVTDHPGHRMPGGRRSWHPARGKSGEVPVS